MERDHPTALRALGGRLAHVVQERRHAQHEVRATRMRSARLEVDGLIEHGEAVFVHVFVVVVLVDLEPERRKLGQHDRRDPGLHEKLEPRARGARAQQFAELVADALDADDR